MDTIIQIVFWFLAVVTVAVQRLKPLGGFHLVDYLIQPVLRLLIQVFKVCHSLPDRSRQLY